LQLPEVLRALSGRPFSQLSWYAVSISLAVILIRMLWIFPATYLPRLLFRSIRERDPYPAWQHVTIVGWAGMRGVVSLAAALALPLKLENGSPFPGRELILFLTFAVILATLVLQGLSLSPLIRWLGVKDDLAAEEEERTARLKANQAAIARLDELTQTKSINPDIVQRLRIEYQDRLRQLEVCAPEVSAEPRRLFSSEYERLSHEALGVERKTILRLRNEMIINDEVHRRIQRDIDLAEVRLSQPTR